MDDELAAPSKAVQFKTFGDVTFLREFAVPFANEVAGQLRNEGFEESLAPFTVPHDLFPTPRGPTNVAGAETAILGISLFVGSSVGGWAVGKLCDYAWGRIQPALQALKNRLLGSGFPSRGITFHFGVWYDSDKVYVLASSELSSAEELDSLESLLADAHRAAVKWIEQKGIRSRVVTFRCNQGTVDDQPSLSDSVPER